VNYLLTSIKKCLKPKKIFNNLFVKHEGSIKLIHNKEFFQTRIAGLISYLGDKTSLMPRLLDIVVENIPMSSHQKNNMIFTNKRSLLKKATQKAKVVIKYLLAQHVILYLMKKYHDLSLL